ncbi:MAG TPA: cobalamin-binding protein [Anaerolineae bacterium]|nr:cobalamin-binding protein [Anaerolineae bacterium]HPL28199.1 cobalamin-binding protein [Anaerolineae bacterium]
MKTMHRFACIALVAALAAAVLGACSPAPAPTQAAPTAAAVTATPAPAAFPVTLTDDDKQQVTVKAEPQRIVSLVPSMTEILFALGLGDRVVGNTTFCDYPEAAKAVEKVGEFANIDLEKVVGLSPDLVLATSLHYQTVAPALRERGIVVAVYEASDVEGTLAQILTIGRLTGRSAEAEALVQELRGRLDAVAAKVAKMAQGAKPRVFWELDAMLYSAGKDSIIDDMITRAGGDNIGSHLAGEWPQFNMESLIAADPEVIFLADHDFGETADKVKARAGWSGITAVKQGRIIEVEDVNLISRPGPRVAEAVEYIAQQLHP